MITVTINGRALEAQPGMTIMEVADKNGIYIPRLCYHKALSPIGACRICVVEVKPGPPRPVPACTTPVTDKMEVTTESERLTHYRRELLQLLLINHPLDCPICDKGGGMRAAKPHPSPQNQGTTLQGRAADAAL